jgi:glycosyltransferase involved in cell wall biosynthesis
VNETIERVSRILIVSAVFPPEPVISAMLSKDIADALSVKNEITVLCPQPSRPEGFTFDKYFEPANYKVRHLDSFTCPSFNLLGRLKESLSFGKYCAHYIEINSANIDCIYINSWPLLSQYKIIRIARKLAIPCVLHIQDIYPESLSNKLPAIVRKLGCQLLLPIDRFNLKNANKIVGISPAMISYLSKTRKVKKEKFDLIRNWQKDEEFINYPSKTDTNKKGFVFMYVGSISASAGVLNLIHAFNKANLGDATLLIAGNGTDKANCVALANRLQNHRIRFSEVTPGQVPEIQSEADVLLLPLKKGIAKTATPSKLTAYLLSSKPVIATVEADSDVANILNEGNCGFIVDPEDEDELAAILKKAYYMQKPELERLGNNGKHYAYLHLTREVNLSKLVATIENTANAN